MTDRLPVSQGRLFTPGRRLGWVFRDPHSLSRPFSEPEPRPRPLPDHVLAQAHHAHAAQRLQRRRAWTVFGTMSVALLAMAGCTRVLGSAYSAGAALSLVVLSVLAATPGVVMAAVAGHRRTVADHALARARQFTEQEHRLAHTAWLERRAAHERAQRAAVAEALEWGSAHAPSSARRLDVIGGSLWGWEALLTVHGASMLSSQPVLVIDLSREVVCRELATLAAAAGRTVHAEVLPAQLAGSVLGAGLSSWVRACRPPSWSTRSWSRCTAASGPRRARTGAWTTAC